MEVLKLVAVFASIMIVLRFKKPLYVSIIVATLVTAVLFQLPIMVFLNTLLQSAISWQTLSVLLLFYLVTFLQRMLEKRGNLTLAQTSLNGIFNSRRITTALAPVFLGLLPSASVVKICGDIVDATAGDDLTIEEKAFVTTYYRHIPESFLPTFSSVIISISLTQGIVTIGPFMIAMLPMVVLLFVLGYVFYLRKIRKEPMAQQSTNKKAAVLSFFRGVWPIGLIIVVILGFNVPAYIATAASILLFVLVGRFTGAELKPFVRTAFETNLLFSTFFIMLFKDVIAATGVIETLPGILAQLPIPEVAIFSLLFIIGTIISGSQAIAVLGIPLAFMAVPSAGLPLFVLLMGLAFAANQLTPTHVCVVIAAEHFKIGFGALVKKSIPVYAVFGVLLVAYYFCLTFIL